MKPRTQKQKSSDMTTVSDKPANSRNSDYLFLKAKNKRYSLILEKSTKKIRQHLTR